MQNINRRPVSMRGIEPGDQQWELALCRVAKGDKAAFSALFAHFGPLIKGMFLRASQPVISDAIAEELVQEVMLKVWQKAYTYDVKKARASTWIFTIARNCRIDLFYRKQNETAPSIDTEDIWNTLESDDCPVDELQRMRSQRQVRGSVEQLPAEQQDVVKRVYMESKSHQQVAEELGLPLGTVKSRIRLALQKLQVMLVN